MDRPLHPYIVPVNFTFRQVNLGHSLESVLVRKERSTRKRDEHDSIALFCALDIGDDYQDSICSDSQDVPRRRVGGFPG
jgi:hypothetical protein